MLRCLGRHNVYRYTCAKVLSSHPLILTGMHVLVVCRVYILGMYINSFFVFGLCEYLFLHYI